MIPIHIVARRMSGPGIGRWRPLAGVATAAVVLICACAPGIVVVSGSTPASPSPAPDSAGPAAIATPVWPIRVREHVDLWLHGFAMLQGDSSLVPFFRRGYRDELTARRTAGGLTTELDTNGEPLRAHLARNPALIAAQFVALYFDTWDDLMGGAALFLRLDGDARAARARDDREVMAMFGTYFATVADRDWLRRFVAALDDERLRFYDRYWRDEQRRLGPVFDALEPAWRGSLGARFTRFLEHARLRNGQVLLSLVLAGEGRTLTGAGREPTVTVGFPRDSVSIETAVYGFAHEIVGAMVNDVVADHTSPADRRSGVADRYASLGAVHAGAMLLERVSPELLSGYQRFYLGLAGVGPGAEPSVTFARTFGLPDALRDALQRQVDIILGGI